MYTTVFWIKKAMKPIMSLAKMTASLQENNSILRILKEAELSDLENVCILQNNQYVSKYLEPYIHHT